MKSNKFLGSLMLMVAVALGFTSLSSSGSDLAMEAAALVGGDDCGVLEYRTCDGKPYQDSTSNCPQTVMGFISDPDGNIKVTENMSCGNHADCNKSPRRMGVCIKKDIDPPIF